MSNATKMHSSIKVSIFVPPIINYSFYIIAIVVGAVNQLIIKTISHFSRSCEFNSVFVNHS